MSGDGSRCEILLAEDERLLRRALAETLEKAGYTVRTAVDGPDTIMQHGRKRPDLMLIDVMMPKMDGISACRRIRETDTSTPVIFLSALDSDFDELRGLEAGGDIYISKTVSKEVLLGRIAAALRRHRMDEPEGDFFFESWRILPRECSMLRKSSFRCPLNEREIVLLRMFSMHPDEVFSRDFLYTKLWNGDDGLTENALTVTIARLRGKLGDDGACIKSIRSSGYVYRPRENRTQDCFI